MVTGLISSLLGLHQIISTHYEFNEEIVKSELIINPKADISQLSEQYQTTHTTFI